LGRRVTITRNFAGVTSRRSDVLADQEPVQTFAILGHLRLDNLLHPLEMGGKSNFRQSKEWVRIKPIMH
jgi:hypothetical protein